MAKNFPYFKFIVTEWMTGDIVFESLSVQGLFINICALYWQRDGFLSISDINKRFKNPEELKHLINVFFQVKDELISIKFLDEQLIEANHISKKNSENGSKGGRPRKSEKNPPLNEKKPAQIEKKQIKEEVNKIKEKESIIVIDNTIFSNECKISEQWIETVAMQAKVKKEIIVLYLDNFEKHLITMQEQKRTVKDFKEHFSHWIKKQNFSDFTERPIGKTNQI